MAVRRDKSVGLLMRARRAGILADDPHEDGPRAGRARSSSPPPKKKVEGVVAQAVERGHKLLVGDAELNGHHFPTELAGAWVAAHRLLHEEDPVEAVAEWGAVVAAARRVLVEYFDGNFEAAIDLVRWSLERANQRRSLPNPRRFTWRSVFNASNVTDFRVATRCGSS